MRIILNRIVVTVLLLSVIGYAEARIANVEKNNKGEKGNGQNKSLAAGCAPATAATELDLNNVRALIQSGGDMWWDFISAQYEVPKGGGTNAIFAGSLWMGGEDVNDQLKLAALRFRQGNDYWTGPLTTDGSAEIDAETCRKYDKHFRITRAMVERHAEWAATGEPSDYQIPEEIREWPAHGDVSQGQDFYLAPFYDYGAGKDGQLADGVYNPEEGDYPYYDLAEEIDCRTNRVVTLYGDETLWWVFNDKGNVHTESGGEPIGMEVRAQAFAFSTNDAVNDMTFYNYELINRGSQTLTNTYFAQWVDADLGCSQDDYVGCDVGRGLGFTYNGNDVDATCNGQTYGANPPAVGVDFFEGPYQDSTGQADDVGIGPNEALNGIGYGDTIVDNERFGMRHFFYHNLGSGPRGDPRVATEYYNYMRGFWKDGTRMTYGGNGYDPSGTNPPADFMFPGKSDPKGWGTGGSSEPEWTEVTAGNQPGDRRFMQSAGPFTLNPGDVNDITVGVVWAKAASGDAFASVEALKTADTKAQSLFENCFEVLDGPDAPVVEIQELDEELILTLHNPSISNNYKEAYADVDPFIPDMAVDEQTNYVLDTATGQYDQVETVDTTYYDRKYRFQGYRIYQVADQTVSPNELGDPDQARLVAQVDLKDDVGELINYELDEDIGASVPVVKADSVNQGVKHSFRITEDQFATTDPRLVNHKEYHYIAIAYAYNNFKDYDPNDPNKLDGQKQPYLESRRSANKGAIKVNTGIPHITGPERWGTEANSEYGDGVKLRRIEGQGNGGLALEFTESSEDSIVEMGQMENPVYKAGSGPIDVKVIDPLSIPNADFEIRFRNDTTSAYYWYIVNKNTNDTVYSDQTISVLNEQLLSDWGLSVTIEQFDYLSKQCPGGSSHKTTEVIESDLSFEDEQKAWLSGVADQDGNTAMNWVRSGSSIGNTPYEDYENIDKEEEFEGLADGYFAPFPLVAYQPAGMPFDDPSKVGSCSDFAVSLSDLQSVEIVFTDDKDQWTRCPVLEMQDDDNLAVGGANKMGLREAPSVDKEGNPDNSGTTGMGWFPGYAINLETGERLNMAFGENSWLSAENGADMLWNPTSKFFTNLGEPLFGGMHYVYIFGNTDASMAEMPAYDEGQFLYDRLEGGVVGPEQTEIWGQCLWVGMPMLIEGEELLATEARVSLRVKKPYEQYQTGSDNKNDYHPMYSFNTADIATDTNVAMTAEGMLDTIKVVPNPYYAYSIYEQSKLENTIKIVNLPPECTVKIYNVSGTLVRTLSKDNDLTYLEWDLNNEARIPIAGGVYIMHVNVPDVGEKVLKWFGVLRPADLDNF